MIGCLLIDNTDAAKERFRHAGLFSDELPEFPAGYQQGNNLWVYLQTGSYYTRHLLLHEGTHAFMERFLGGYGPPWYAEGMAELIAVHRWSDGQLELNATIRDRKEVPHWGRAKLIRQDVAAGKSRSLDEVFSLGHSAFRDVHSYAWAWAACEFLSQHPQTQQVFQEQANQVLQENFNRILKQQLADVWPELQEQWNWMLQEIDYGYDVANAAPVPAIPTNDEPQAFQLSAERGWQTTELQLVAGTTYRFVATGEYQIKQDAERWPCQPGGVTIEYYRDHPLGMVLGAVRTEQGLATPFVIGEAATITVEATGTLYLRVNDSPSAWHDNLGHCPGYRGQIVTTATDRSSFSQNSLFDHFFSDVRLISKRNGQAATDFGG